MKRLLPRLIFIFSLLLLGSGYAMKTYSVIKVQNIVVKGTECIVPEDIPAEIGDNIFDINFNTIIDSVLTNQFVAKVKVHYDIKANLIVEIKEKQAVCLLYDKQLFGVTSNCELISDYNYSDNLSLPVIRGIELNSRKNFRVINHSGLRSALKLVQTMRVGFPEQFKKLSEIIIHDNGLNLILEPGTIFIKVGFGSYLDKLEKLNVVLATEKNPGINIDLRLAEYAIMKKRILNREVHNGI